jgi:hypothetical protein
MYIACTTPCAEVSTFPVERKRVRQHLTVQSSCLISALTPLAQMLQNTNMYNYNVIQQLQPFYLQSVLLHALSAKKYQHLMGKEPLIDYMPTLFTLLLGSKPFF